MLNLKNVYLIPGIFIVNYFGAKLITSFNFNKLIIFITPIIGISLIIAPDKWILFLPFICFFLDPITFWLDLPTRFFYLLDFYILALFFINIFRRQQSLELFNTGLVKWILIILIVPFFSIQYNPLLLFIITYFREHEFLLFFLILLLLKRDQQFFKNLLSIIILLILVQIPISIAQKRLMGPISPDHTAGFLGRGNPATYVAVLMPYMIALFTGFILKVKFRPRYVLIIFLCLLPLILGSGRAGILFSVIALVVVYWADSIITRPTSKNIIVMPGLVIAVIVALSFAVINIMPKLDRRDVIAWRLLTSPEAMMDYSSGVEKGGGFGRIEILRFSLKRFSDGIPILLFGYGTGSTERIRFFDQTGYLLNLYGGLIRRGKHSLGKSLLERGIIGTVSLLILYMMIAFKSLKISLSIHDGYWKSIALGVFGMSVITLIASLYANIWSNPPIAITYWSFTGALFSYYSSLTSQNITRA